MVAIGRISRTAPPRWTRRHDAVERRRTGSSDPAFPEIVAGLPAVIASPGEADRLLKLRPAAPFVAQLIANRFNLPQMRRRRTASSQEAEASYLAADVGRRGMGPGCIVRREI